MADRFPAAPRIPLAGGRRGLRLVKSRKETQWRGTDKPRLRYVLHSYLFFSIAHTCCSAAADLYSAYHTFSFVSPSFTLYPCHGHADSLVRSTTSPLVRICFRGVYGSIIIYRGTSTKLSVLRQTRVIGGGVKARNYEEREIMYYQHFQGSTIARLNLVPCWTFDIPPKDSSVQALH